MIDISDLNDLGTGKAQDPVIVIRKMHEVRQLMQHTLGSRYDSATGPYKTEIDKVMKAADCSALKATGMILREMCDADPWKPHARLLLLSAGLDMGLVEGNTKERKGKDSVLFRWPKLRRKEPGETEDPII